MKILILGAGRVGATLAHHLSHEANDITLIDTNPDSLQTIQDRCDVKTIVGNGAYPQILDSAGIEDADMLIAVTNRDEINMLACQLAYSLYKTPTKIARIRSQAYTQASDILFRKEALPIDVVISPEQLITDMVTRLIHYPGTLQVLGFAENKLLLVVVKVQPDSRMSNCTIQEYSNALPGVELRITAIYRKNEFVYPHGDTVIEANDEIFFLCASCHMKPAISLFREQPHPYKRIMLAGGGHVGSNVASRLEKNYTVKIIEHNTVRTQIIADELENTVVLEGDASDRTLLLDENIEECDVFCALTNNDEVNIMSALLAKRLGVHKVISLVNNSSYVELIESSAIDIVISPQQATLSSLLSHVRKADIVQVHTLRHGDSEAIEVVVHGSQSSSKVVGKRIDEIDWPPQVRVGAIVRNGSVIIAHHDTVLLEADHVVLFIPDARYIPDVEQLFQVGLTFF